MGLFFEQLKRSLTKELEMKIEQVAEGIARVQSGVPGPAVAIVGGTHGDEKTGIQVVYDLTRDFGQGVLRLARGVLYLVLANLAAIERGTRGSTDGANLNRCFTANVLAGEGNTYEERRARDLAQGLASVEIGVDIHATIKPSEPFVVCQRQPKAEDERVYRWFGVESILTDPNWVFAGERVTLDEYFARNGGVGICYETGVAGDTSRVAEVTGEMINLFTDLGLFGHGRGLREYRNIRSTHQVVWELTQAITLDKSGFDWQNGHGERNWQKVVAGEVVGSCGDDTMVAGEDSVIIFPKPKRLWQAGLPVGYLARRVL